MRNYRYLFILSIVVGFFTKDANAQCLLQPLSLETKIIESSIIIEGKIISKESFWVENPRRIVTKNTILVYKSFKGPNLEKVSFISEGGKVGDEIHVTEPNISVLTNDIGMFFLTPDKMDKDMLVSFGSPHGFYQYDQVNGTASAPFALLSNVKTQLYTPIVNKTKQQYQDRMNFELKAVSKKEVSQMSGVNVNSFEPSSITAGTGDELRILGSGFGTTGTLAFRDPDNGGSNFANVHPSNIKSWSPSQIVVRVPSKAGTGTVSINSVQSTIPVEIIYNTTEIPAQTNQNGTFNAELLHILSSNKVGGITYSPSTSFKNDTAAYTCFLRSMETWRCGTNINFTIAPNATTQTVAVRDGINIAMFDDTQPLPNGVLGVTQSYYSFCQETAVVFLAEVDFRFDNTPSGGWNFGPNPTNGGKIDFQSVVTHEMGHAHQLGHVNDNKKVMNWSIAPNTDLRILNFPSDVGGGTRVLTRSAGKSCSVSDTFEILRKIPTDGCQLKLPVADFRGDKTSGCAPLTVEFTDLSKNTPLTYQWDFNDDGIIDATTVQPTYTFLTPGNYTVKLTVTNAFGANVGTKTAYITANQGVTASVLKDTAICAGDSLFLYAIPEGTATVTWSAPIGVPDRNKETIALKPISTTLYTVNINGNGCIQTFTMNVKVDSKPTKPVVTVIGTTQLRSTGTLPKRYYWYIDGSLTQEFTSSTITPTVSGEYRSQWESQAGCLSDLSDPFMFTPPPVSVLDLNLNQAFSVIPNPAETNVSIKSAQEQILSIELLSSTGHSIQNEVFGGFTYNTNSATFSVRSLANGLYFVKVTTPSSVKIVQFIKQ